MLHYFVRHATTNYGPFNCAVAVKPGQTLQDAMNEEAKRRNLIVCHDYTASFIPEREFQRIVA